MEKSVKQRLGSLGSKGDRGKSKYAKVEHEGLDECDHPDTGQDEGGATCCAAVLLWVRAVWSKGRGDIASSVQEAKRFPADMRYVLWLKFLESYSYFALSQILVLYLHEEFGVPDIEAGMVYGMWGAAITCGGLLVSWVNDNLGVRKSLCIGFSLSLVSSIIVALTTSKTLLYVTLFALYPFGTAMGIPMLTVAVKRYTTERNRGVAFGIYYSVMNMAALVSGPVVDGLYIGLKGQLSNGWTGYRIVILSCGFSNLISLLISARCIRDINIEEGNGLEDQNSRDRAGYISNPVNEEWESHSDHNSENSFGESRANSRITTDFTPVQQHPWTTAKMLCRSKTFWRFSVLTLFLVNLHAIFRHLDATLPTYLVRCFGDNVPKGSIYSINPFMIIFLTPLVAACTNNSNHFDMIKYGGFVTGVSPFFLAIDTSIAAVVCMLVVLSLGEAIWSPRLYDYVMSIAPEGREASFSALASAPLFAAKIPVGLMSGYLLQTYLPEEDEEGEDEVHQRPKTMWLIIGLMTLTSPVLIAVFDSCIREPEKALKLGSENDINGRNRIDTTGNYVLDNRASLELSVLEPRSE